MKQWYWQFSKKETRFFVKIIAPIPLFAIGYKLFVTILLCKLKATGANTKIWSTQFGFRTGRGRANGLFVARRLLEQTCAVKNGSLSFLALDLAKVL